MILESLVDLARREGLLANPDYVPLPVAWILAVGDEGKFLSAIPTAGETVQGKKPRAKVLAIPRRRGLYQLKLTVLRPVAAALRYCGTLGGVVLGGGRIVPWA